MQKLPPQTNTYPKLPIFEVVRNITMLFVVIYHSIASYSSVAPYWPVLDSESHLIFDVGRYVIDVFVMSIFFFIAGCFAVGSIQNKGSRDFLRSKFIRLDECRKRLV